MPDFTQWNVPTPFTNVLFNPMAVDKAIADNQSTLGNLDINRQKLALEQAREADAMAGGKRLIDSLTGNTTGTTGADVTPFEQKMGISEGGRSATKVNDQGYAGQYQFGASRLADLGLYTPAPGEDLKKNEWKGTFKIAPYGVANLQDFLGSPAAQHAAFVAHVADIDKAIAATPGADKFDVNGLRAVAHLGGVGGMQAFIASGGNLNRADSNGTSLKSYYQKFASGGAPALQQAFGSVHGPGGPPSDTPAVQPGGNVSTAWVDPNAPLPVPPIPPAGGPPPAFNPNAGPRVAGASPAGAPGAAPVVAPQAAPGVAPTDLTTGHSGRPTVYPPPPTITGQADETAPAVAQTKTAMRLNGTDVAGPPGVVPAPPDAQPNRLAYGTDLPGVTIGLPTNGMAPPPTAAAPVTTATAPASAPATQAKPPVLQPPPALQRAIPPPQVLPSGLTAGETQIVAGMVQARTPVAQVAQFIETAKQRNTALQQQYLANQATVDQANFDRQKYYTEQLQKTGWEPQPDGSLKNKYTGDTKWPPTPRFTTQEGVGVLAAMPGGDIRLVSPINPAGIITQRSSESQGTEAGKDAGKQLPALMVQGRAATQAIGNIDYGMNQVREATKSGIPTGYFSQGLATAAAAAKSLGIDTTALGVDPAAVGNIQSAQKTLGVVAGAILQQAIGKDSQITDAKIQHFIHTQPGIETDPHAIERVLNWARSQFVYENEMSAAAMKEAAGSPTGTLPLNWQPRYYRDKGFAPIYDPGSGEMRQPEGQQPTREPPKGPPPTAPVNPSERKANTVYSTPKGALTWTGTGWLAPAGVQ